MLFNSVMSPENVNTDHNRSKFQWFFHSKFGMCFISYLTEHSWSVLVKISISTHACTDTWLTHCGLVTPWRHRTGATLDQVMTCCLTAPGHYLNHNVDLSSVRFSGIHLRAISLEIPQPPFNKISLKITYLKLNWNLAGANELMHLLLCLIHATLSAGHEGEIIDNIVSITMSDMS